MEMFVTNVKKSLLLLLNLNHQISAKDSVHLQVCQEYAVKIKCKNNLLLSEFFVRFGAEWQLLSLHYFIFTVNRMEKSHACAGACLKSLF